MVEASTQKTTELNARQVADVQVALGRSLEKRGEPGQAMAHYAEALQRDPNRADACVRMAIIYDQQGKFDQSLPLYQKALAARPGDPDIFCNWGYSMYLQDRLGEAEMNLRQALALQHDHQRAHNNLGMVLARLNRGDEAFSEFRRAGCTEVDAHLNLAFALTLTRDWPAVKEHYEAALAADPKCAAAKKGLLELNAVFAKEKGTPQKPVLANSHPGSLPATPSPYAPVQQVAYRPDGPSMDQANQPATAEVPSRQTVPSVCSEVRPPTGPDRSCASTIR
jgi:Flp pilus assembly protein TadD